MKRVKSKTTTTQVPLTAFFQRKAPRLEDHPSVRTSPVSSAEDRSAQEKHVVETIDDESEEDVVETKSAPPKRQTAKANPNHLVRLIQQRECAGRSKRRQRQHLVRWVLTHFQMLPVELQLPMRWQQQAGRLHTDVFYTSCMEFDAQGVLLVAGSSNGIVTLYDFDEYAHRTMNLAQRVQVMNNPKEQAGMNAAAPAQRPVREVHELLEPIHTIFVSFEIKRIRWNPYNQDEIAVSYGNKNEIHLFNLQKFPTKPHRVIKTMSRPSSGYNDLVFLPTNGPSTGNTRPHSIIAGDMDGSLRSWNPRAPARPIWSISTGSQPINAIVLSRDNQYAVCGTEGGFLATYDVKNLSVPAFGFKAVPRRVASFHVLEIIKPYLTSEYASAQGGAAVMSIQIAPFAETQVLCQLRNDWVVVVDFLDGRIIKLHTFIKESMIPRPQPVVAASVAVTPNLEPSSLYASTTRLNRDSWLGCHRCTGTLLFDQSIFCTGAFDALDLNVIDLQHLPRTPSIRRDLEASGNDYQSASTVLSQRISSGQRPSIQRLDRFRIPTDDLVTAVSAHPVHHLVVCGGEHMRLRVLGMAGERQEPENESLAPAL